MLKNTLAVEKAFRARHELKDLPAMCLNPHRQIRDDVYTIDKLTAAQIICRQLTTHRTY